MKIKSQLTLATLVVVGMFAAGCQQNQSVSGQTTTECAPCKEEVKQQPQVRVDANAHTHPAVPACTNSITHTHPSNNPNHSHHYSCKQGVRQVPQIPQVKAKGNYRGPVMMDQSSRQMMQQYQN